jgi:AcrR family transcriptional regulator
MLASMPRRAEKSPPRRRLEAEDARAKILDATEKRLVVGGPAGIRLLEVAAEAGVSHPTVLHHFGSRERLVEAVIARSVAAIHADLVKAIAASGGDEARLEAIVENVARALERSGHARVMMWLSLEGHRVDDAEAGLRAVIDTTHALRVERCGPANAPSREDSARTVVLAALALVGGAVLGPSLLPNAGLGSGARAAAAFRKWLARVLLEHLDR